MALWQKFLTGFYVICSSFVAAIQFIEKDTFGESYYPKWLAITTANNRAWMSLISGVVAGTLAIVVIALQPYKARKQMRDSLMDGIFEQVLENDKTLGRVTLFEDASRLRCWWFKIWDFFGLLRHGWALKKVAFYCWEAHYIKIYQRWGTDHKRSKTYFCFNTETREKCQGIAGQVRQREEKIVATLPDLSTYDLKQLDENHPVVREYMDKGHINNFRALKSIKRPSIHIYGNIISIAGGRKKMVLIIDSWAEKNPFSPKAQYLLSTYVKQISASFGS